MDKIERIVTHLNAIQEKETFKTYLTSDILNKFAFNSYNV
jgi:hypothetical protein